LERYALLAAGLRPRTSSSLVDTTAPQRAQIERVWTRPPQSLWTAMAEDGSP
jgi:hypothetical protein